MSDNEIIQTVLLAAGPSIDTPLAEASFDDNTTALNWADWMSAPEFANFGF
jgi:hypothetical protein